MAEAASVELETPRPNRGKKWTLAVAIAVVLAAAAGAAMQLVGGAADNEPQAVRKRDPIFVSLEQFTVNLADEGGERFAQIGVTLEVADEQTDKALRASMPSVRNSVLLLLSSKKSAELLTLDGKKLLASQIAAAAAAELGAPAVGDGEKPNPIAAVNFSHFIIQ